MRIAILGATSQIARDLIMSFSAEPETALVLFGRDKERIVGWLQQNLQNTNSEVKSYAEFKATDHFDVIINFVGSGDPARTEQLGPKILDLTREFDDLAMSYVKANDQCKYIFLSSGAVFGSDFTDPVSENSVAKFRLNQLNASNWYGFSKAYAECNHRAHASLPIVDVRVFNYFSHSQDITAKFFISQIIQAIFNRKSLSISPEPMVRDYLGDEDFSQLIKKILQHEYVNVPIDCYTKNPSTKEEVINYFKRDYNLNYILDENEPKHLATGEKTNYYSTNKAAEKFSYKPLYSSLESIKNGFSIIAQRWDSLI
jgi:nucleoside-diphosphate-sugar epimerase